MDDDTKEKKKTVKKEKTKDKETKDKTKPSTPKVTKKAATTTTSTTVKKTTKETPSKPSTPATKKSTTASTTTPKLKKEASSKKVKEVKKDAPASPATPKSGKITKDKKTTSSGSLTKPAKKVVHKVATVSAAESHETNNHVDSEHEADSKHAANNNEAHPDTAHEAVSPPTTPPPATASTNSSSTNSTTHVEEQPKEVSETTTHTEGPAEPVAVQRERDLEPINQDLIDAPIQAADLSNSTESIRTRIGKLLDECQGNAALLLDIYNDVSEYLKSKGITSHIVEPTTPTSNHHPIVDFQLHHDSHGTPDISFPNSPVASLEKRVTSYSALAVSIDSSPLTAYSAHSTEMASLNIVGMSSQEKVYHTRITTPCHKHPRILHSHYAHHLIIPSKSLSYASLDKYTHVL